MKKILLLIFISLASIVSTVFLPNLLHKSDLSLDEYRVAEAVCEKHLGGCRRSSIVFVTYPTEKRVINGEETYLYVTYGPLGLPFRKTRIYLDEGGGSPDMDDWSIWNGSW